MILWKHISHSAQRLTSAPAIAAGLAAIVTMALAAASAAGTPAGTHDGAHTARVLSVNDTAVLHTADPNSTSSTIVEEGRAGGTLPGTVRAHLAVGVSTVIVGFTIYLHGGTISGQAVGKLNPGKGEYASFKGTLNVAHGSGHYAHATGSGQVYGTLNHYSYEAKVQVIGQLHY